MKREALCFILLLAARNSSVPEGYLGKKKGPEMKMNE